MWASAGSGRFRYSTPACSPTTSTSTRSRRSVTLSRARVVSHMLTPGDVAVAATPPDTSNANTPTVTPLTSSTSGASAAASSAPPPTARRPAASSAAIVSSTVSGPASLAWLLATPSTSNPAPASTVAAAPGSASSGYGPATCGRVVSGDSRLPNARSAPARAGRSRSNTLPGSAATTGATPRPSIRSPTNTNRTTGRAPDTSGSAACAALVDSVRTVPVEHAAINPHRATIDRRPIRPGCAARSASHRGERHRRPSAGGRGGHVARVHDEHRALRRRVARGDAGVGPGEPAMWADRAHGALADHDQVGARQRSATPRIASCGSSRDTVCTDTGRLLDSWRLSSNPSRSCHVPHPRPSGRLGARPTA